MGVTVFHEPWHRVTAKPGCTTFCPNRLALPWLSRLQRCAVQTSMQVIATPLFKDSRRESAALVSLYGVDGDESQRGHVAADSGAGCHLCCSTPPCPHVNARTSPSGGRGIPTTPLAPSWPWADWSRREEKGESREDGHASPTRRTIRSRPDSSPAISSSLSALHPTPQMAFAFEKLNVCGKSVDFADTACTLTRGFPRVYFFLADQLNRAAHSSATSTLCRVATPCSSHVQPSIQYRPGRGRVMSMVSPDWL